MTTLTSARCPTGNANPPSHLGLLHLERAYHTETEGMPFLVSGQPQGGRLVFTALPRFDFQSECTAEAHEGHAGISYDSCIAVNLAGSDGIAPPQSRGAAGAAICCLPRLG